MECGTEAPWVCIDCGHPKKVKTWCGSKLCPSCARRKSARMRAGWENAAVRLPRQHGYGWKLVTLTLAKMDMASDYKRGVKAFQKLSRNWARRHPGCGGFRCFEVGSDGNVHLHVLAYLPFVAQKEISDEWLALTGDSKIVDIRAVKGGVRGGLREVCKYITKLSLDRDVTELVDIYAVMRAKQPVRPWGAMHGLVTKADFPVVQKPECENCGSTRLYPEFVVEAMKRAGRVNWGRKRGPPS